MSLGFGINYWNLKRYNFKCLGTKCSIQKQAGSMTYKKALTQSMRYDITKWKRCITINNLKSRLKYIKLHLYNYQQTTALMILGENKNTKLPLQIHIPISNLNTISWLQSMISHWKASRAFTSKIVQSVYLCLKTLQFRQA